MTEAFHTKRRVVQSVRIKLYVVFCASCFPAFFGFFILKKTMPILSHRWLRVSLSSRKSHTFRLLVPFSLSPKSKPRFLRNRHSLGLTPISPSLKTNTLHRLSVAWFRQLSSTAPATSRTTPRSSLARPKNGTCAKSTPRYSSRACGETVSWRRS